MPLAEKRVRGKGRQPLSPPSAGENGARGALCSVASVMLTWRRFDGTAGSATLVFGVGIHGTSECGCESMLEALLRYDGIPLRPSRHIIKGVPFVAWGDARKWIAADSDTNPSLLASNAMAMEYWGENGAPSDKSPATEWPHFEIQTREDLEDTLAQDIPVVVFAGLTPFGHPTATEWVMNKWGDPCLADAAAKMLRHSGVLGTVLSYEVFAQATLPILLRESVFTSPRVAVGYNDDTGILLHDPCFGPAWEIEWTDFEKMWAPFEHNAITAHPSDWKARLRRDAEPYAARGTDQRAAEHFAFGYALACIGEEDKARERYQKGIDLPALSQGWRHLFCVELALLAPTAEERVSLLREACRIAPDAPKSRRLLADLYWRSGLSPLSPARILGRLLAIWAAGRALASQDSDASWLPDEILLFPRGTEMPPSPDYLAWMKSDFVRALVAIIYAIKYKSGTSQLLKI